MTSFGNPIFGGCMSCQISEWKITVLFMLNRVKLKGFCYLWPAMHFSSTLTIDGSRPAFLDLLALFI